MIVSRDLLDYVVRWARELRGTAVVAVAGVVGTGVAAGAGLLVGGIPFNAAWAVQALLAACAAGWIGQVVPRAWRAVGWWRPVAITGPVLLGSLPGAIPIIACATALAVLRGRGGRPAAAALIASGPFAVTIAVPHTGEGWLGVICAGGAVAAASITAYALTAVLPPPPTSTKRSRSRTPPPWPEQLATAAAVAVGVTAAVLLGGWLFPAHARWPVLTVFIVLGGGTELGASATKAAHRLAGAVLGTTVGAVVQFGLHPTPLACLATAAVVVLLGYTLRPVGYLWWSAGMTASLVLASVTPSWEFAVTRTAALLVGGLVAITAAAASRRGRKLR